MPNIASKIAKKLAKIHELDVPICKEVGTNDNFNFTMFDFFQPEFICDALDRFLMFYNLIILPSNV